MYHALCVITKENPLPSLKRRLFKADINLMPLPRPHCPICSTDHADFRFRTVGDMREFWGWCPACTNVSITSEAVEFVKGQRTEHLLAAYLRRLPVDDWDSRIGSVISVGAVKDLTASVPELTILEQFDLALRLVCDMCAVAGERSTFSYEVDWPLLTARSSETVNYILWELARAGFLRHDELHSPIIPMPTWKAYQRLQAIQSTGRNSDAGFVAMSFSKEMTRIWTEVIRPAIVESGYQAIRVDMYEHNRRIDDEIIAQIRRCRFLVADFTEQRMGVYFEAGFALGLGRNVIWMCKKSDHEKLHFDTRQFNHILYEDLPTAKRDLTNRIVALEGQGTYAG